MMFYEFLIYFERELSLLLIIFTFSYEFYEKEI